MNKCEYSSARWPCLSHIHHSQHVLSSPSQSICNSSLTLPWTYLSTRGYAWHSLASVFLLSSTRITIYFSYSKTLIPDPPLFFVVLSPDTKPCSSIQLPCSVEVLVFWVTWWPHWCHCHVKKSIQTSNTLRKVINISFRNLAKADMEVWCSRLTNKNINDGNVDDDACV